MQKRDLTGEIFGELTVLEESRLSGKVAWKCSCSCGNITTVITAALNRRNTRSCGHLQRDVAAELSRRHGATGSRTYNVWRGMHARCTYSKSPRFKDYGGRGIRVCSRWGTFELFLQDMGECPEGMSIDRKDNHGDYSPENCQWATPKEQALNNRRTVTVRWGDVTDSLRGWANRLGVSPHTVKRNVEKVGPQWLDKKPRRSVSRNQ